MSWRNSPDCQAAQDDIKHEIQARGWDRLSYSSSAVEKSIGVDERRQFVPHLVHTYPDAHKGPDAWIKFIRKLTGQVRLCHSASASYIQTSNDGLNLAKKEARLKRTLGKGLSQEDLIEQDLDLSPAQEKLVAGQVNVLCVCADMKVCVCAWVAELVTLLTGCAGARLSVQLGSGAGLEKGSVKRT